MSIKTWKSEFYPKPVEETSPEEAILHSLRKWEGLRPENIQKHSVNINCFGNIYDDRYNRFNVDNRSCSLCHHYYDDIKDADERCDACPLSIVRGGKSCESATDTENIGMCLPPWNQYTENGNPEPMIFWLKKALTQFCGK